MTIEACVNGLQHLGLPVSDLQETIRFYERLGFQVIRREMNPAGNQPVAFLELKGTVIEAYQQDPVARQTGAWAHVAFDVSDIEAAWEAVKTAGLEPLETEIQYLPFWKAGVRYFNIEGPNQEVIEFIEKLSASAKEG